MKKILLIIILLIGTVSLNAATYYVATSGHDTTGNGTIGTPWRSLYKASQMVTTANDLIHINAGTYLELHTCQIAVKVTVEGVGDATIIILRSTINPVGGIAHGAIELVSTPQGTDGSQEIRYLKLIGTGTPNGSVAIFMARRSNVKFHHLTIYDFKVNGIYVVGAANMVTVPTTYATGNEIYNCTISKCATSDSTYSTYENGGLISWGGQQGMDVHHNTLSNKDRPKGENGNGVAVGRANKGCKFRDNVSTMLDDNGRLWNFHIESWDVAGGYEIYNNQFIGGNCAIDIGGFYNVKGSYAFSFDIHDNYFAPLVKAVDTYHPNYVITVEGPNSNDVLIHDNHFYKQPHPVSIEGTWPNATKTATVCNNIQVYRNLMEKCGYENAGLYYVILQASAQYPGSTIDSIFFYNNIIDSDVTKNTGISISTNAGVTMTNLRIINNVIQHCQNGSFIVIVNNGAINDFVLRNNNIYDNKINVIKLTGNPLGTNIITNNITSNPLFVSSSDFHLQTLSPARNAGINVGLPYLETAPDIGRYEYVIETPVVIAVVTMGITSVLSRSAVTYGDIILDGGGTISAKGVCWSTSANPTIANSKTVDGTGTAEYTSTITGLLSNTTYHVRAYATNEAGTAYSNEISIFTSVGSVLKSGVNSLKFGAFSVKY